MNIVFTGGGTAGHVTPNMALIEILRTEGGQFHYIGSADGVERSMITGIGVPYHAVSSGKLRRYFSWKNFLDPLKIIGGIVQSFFILKKIKPDVVFSKGGFVAFPVVVGAWLNQIPVIAHESDMSPGLANRLSFPFARKICTTFANTKKHFKAQQQAKVEYTGTPIRQQLFKGDKAKALALCGFNENKPCLLVIGGSQGAQALNSCVRESLDTLCEHYQVIHLCGKGKVDSFYVGRMGYCQFEYVQEELADLFAASDLVISRSGANSLCEILALSKPHVLIPLSQKVSRGDQVHNARYFEQQGISVVIPEEQLNAQTLLAAVCQVEQRREAILERLKTLALTSGTTKIIALLKEYAHGNASTTN